MEYHYFTIEDIEMLTFNGIPHLHNHLNYLKNIVNYFKQQKNVISFLKIFVQ